MIVSNTPNQVSSSRLRVLVLLFAVSIPLGAVRAQDNKAKSDAYLKQVYKKLEAAVAAGKMTKEEAAAKMADLKKKAYAKIKAGKKGDEKKIGTHLENVWTELQALVAAGKMSPEDATVVMSTIKKSLLRRISGSDIGPTGV